MYHASSALVRSVRSGYLARSSSILARIFLPGFRDDETRVEIDHDHAAVLLDELENLIRHVAGRWADGVGTGVAGDQRRFGNPQASAMVAGDTCEISTSMPSRFISLTTRSPNGVRPSCLGVSVAASAQSRVVLWVSVM